MAEIWRPVDGWPYEASNEGRVRNARTGRVLKLTAHKSGYLQVQLWNRQKYKTFLVSRLVAAAFLGPAPTTEHEAQHIDTDWHNNRSVNLRWATHNEIMRARDVNGATARGARNGKLKNADGVVLAARRLRDEGNGPAEIGRKLGITPNAALQYGNRSRRETVREARP